MISTDGFCDNEAGIYDLVSRKGPGGDARVAWIMRLVKTGAEGRAPWTS